MDALFSSEAKNGPSGASNDRVARIAPGQPEDDREHVEQPRHDHQRQEARHDEVLDRVHAEHLERVELLADLAGAEVGRDRRAADAGEDDRRDERRELADRGEHEEAAEPVDGAEQDQEVARLEPRRAVAHGEHRDRERHPAEAQHEEELLHELGAVRIRRPQRGDQRLAGQDHHVADLLEQVLGRQEHPVSGGSDHQTQCAITVLALSQEPSVPSRHTSVLSHRHSAVGCVACRANSISASTVGPVSPWGLSWPAASGRRSRTASSPPVSECRASGSSPTSRA